jgi:superfamily II DNA or RNA helicase
MSNETEIELFGEKETRWYQRAAVNGVAKSLANGVKRIMVVMPTGAGKTMTSGMIFGSDEIRRLVGVVDRPLNLLFIAHKHRLLTQAENEYANASNVNFIAQSSFMAIPKETLDIVDLICMDECHHEAMMTIQYQLEHIGEFPIIGLTATPDRADGLVIKFEDTIEPISRQQAVEEGFLAETNLHTIVDSPAKDKTEITKSIIDEFGDQFGQTMMFFRTKTEVASICDYLTDKGYNAVAVLNQSNAELDNILNQFSNGQIQFILNCNKINEGVDVRGCTDVYLGRQFGSYPQLNQVIGRASRPDSECNVWELINPIHGRNLDTTIVVGTPAEHRLLNKRQGVWYEQSFDYQTV